MPESKPTPRRPSAKPATAEAPKRPYVPPRLIREEPLDWLTASEWEVAAHGGSP